jgi:adenylosuccinate lyase
MPHKRNPILSERDGGLARVLAATPDGAREPAAVARARHQPLSAERVILPDATILLDYLLVKVAGLVEASSCGPSGCARTSSAASGSTPRRGSCWRSVERAGCSREEAYAIVQRAALAAADERRPLRELLALDRSSPARCSLAELDACFDDAPPPAPRPRVIDRLDTLTRTKEVAGAHG